MQEDYSERTVMLLGSFVQEVNVHNNVPVETIFLVVLLNRMVFGIKFDVLTNRSGITINDIRSERLPLAGQASIAIFHALFCRGAFPLAKNC